MTLDRATFGLTRNTGLTPCSVPGWLREARLVGGNGQVWSSLRAGLTDTDPTPISGPIFLECTSVTQAPSPSHTRTLGQDADLQAGLLNPPGKKKPPIFHIPERLPPEPPRWLFITQGGWEITGLLNKLSPDPLSQVGTLSHLPTPHTSAGFSLLHTMSLCPHLGAPHALPRLQPAQLSPPLPPGPLLSANPCSDCFLFW